MRPAPGRLSIGTMLEVPALLWQLPELLREVDFISVGSNDLMQFLFAADRGSPALASRYDLLSRAGARPAGRRGCGRPMRPGCRFRCAARRHPGRWRRWPWSA